MISEGLNKMLYVENVINPILHKFFMDHAYTVYSTSEDCFYRKPQNLALA